MNTPNNRDLDCVAAILDHCDRIGMGQGTYLCPGIEVCIPVLKAIRRARNEGLLK